MKANIETALLEGMPSTKKPRKKVVKRHFTTKNVPVETSVRRQVAEEIGEAEPTRDQKFVLLQKYGVTAPRIDRQISKPHWMGVSTWKRLLNEWFKATKGLVKPQQSKKFNQPTPNSPQQFRPSQKQLGRPYQKNETSTVPSWGSPTAKFKSRTTTFRRNFVPIVTANPQN